MPVSNGQITKRDIRQSVIHDWHIRDEHVTTTKLEDLAVTLEKNATVIDWEQGLDQTQNVTVDTTWAAHVAVDIDVPAWAGIMALSTSSVMQATITADTTFAFWTTIDSPGTEPSGAFTHELAMTGTRHLGHTRYWEATVTPGTTITAEFWIKTISGSNSSNIIRLDTLALFAR